MFRVNRRDREGELTQFGRALRTLDIASIHAHSPQAKGRVERANRTLQDRLVKEMRLRGIGDMAAANAYLPEFMADFNRRFAVAPRAAQDAHREVLHDAGELDLILCEQHARKLTKNLAISFEGRLYQVTGRGKGYRLRGAAVTVCKGFDGAVTVLRDSRELPVRLLAEGRTAGAGGGREDGAPAGRAGEGGAAVATGVEAAAGSSLAATAQARGGRGRRMTAAPPRSSVAPLPSRTATRQSQRLPRTRNPRPERQGDISTLEKRGHFYFALTGIAGRSIDPAPTGRLGRLFRSWESRANHATRIRQPGKSRAGSRRHCAPFGDDLPARAEPKALAARHCYRALR